MVNRPLLLCNSFIALISWGHVWGTSLLFLQCHLVSIKKILMVSYIVTWVSWCWKSLILMEQRWNLPLRDLWVITHLSTHEENTAHHFSLFVCLSVRAYVYPGGVIAGHCLVAYRVARSRQSSECIHARDGSECVCVEFVDRAVVHRNGQWKSRRTWPDPGYNGKQTANTEGERGRDERKETEREIRGLVRGAADSFYVRRRERQEKKCLSQYEGMRRGREDIWRRGNV